MTRYRLRIVDGAGLPARAYDQGDDLNAAIEASERMVADDHAGGTVEVVDTTIGQPDRSIVHVARRAR